MNLRTLAYCVPTILVTLVTGFVPWGLVTALITLILCGVTLFLPSKIIARTNAKVALEGLSYGRLDDANDHIDIALREAENATGMPRADIAILRDAYDKVASALLSSGHVEAGSALRKRGDAVISRLESSAL